MLCSVTIAVAAFASSARWVPIPIGVIGIMCLFWGSVLMLMETRMATATVNAEMDFTWQLAREVAPKEVAVKYSRKGKIKGLSTARRRDSGRKVPDTFGGE